MLTQANTRAANVQRDVTDDLTVNPHWTLHRLTQLRLLRLLRLLT